MLEVVEEKNREIQNLESSIKSLKTQIERAQPSLTTINNNPTNSPIVSSESPIVSPDVVITTERLQPSEIVINSECPIVSSDSRVSSDTVDSTVCSHPRGTTERVLLKTNEIRTKRKTRDSAKGPKYNIPLLTGCNFNFIPEKSKNANCAVEQGERRTGQSSRGFFGGPSHTLPGQEHEVSLSTESGQIAAWRTNNHNPIPVLNGFNRTIST